MSHQIAPLILEKLQAFSQRRRNLIIVRGVCAGLAMLLATMMLVALVDWLFVLPDWLRWTLSGVAYAAVIIVEWRSCLRMLMHAPGPRRLARLIEHAEPKLREDLLSAVELGDPKSDAAFDSEQFRALLQTDVAHRMEGMEVERLLPVNLVRRYLTVAAVILLALIAGFAATGLQFGTLLARALLPGANLARVSKFRVTIVTPDPAEKIVPHGETVPLVVAVEGGRASKAVLEIFSESGAREVVQMAPLPGDQFSATIQVARENVRYRVRAGDAITRKFQLGAVARPHVVAFAKTYKFPQYARLADKQVSEENGDLVALEGSDVDLHLETNQAIKSGELRIEQDHKQLTVPLTAEPGGKLTGRVPMNFSGTYRVFLVGAETGFENKFSPEYEIRAEPDLVPQVDLELPKQDLIIPANEIVDVRGTASDDLSLAKVAQLVRINTGPWKETILATDAGPAASVERRWDLFHDGAKAGDLITTKLLAVDLKGHRVESRPIQLTITASGFETKRLTSVDAQRQFFQTLVELRVAAELFEKRSREARDLFEDVPDGDPQRKQACVSGALALQEIEQTMTATWAQLEATLRPAAAGHESHDLVLVGRLLAKMNPGTLRPGGDALELATADPAAPNGRELLREFSEAGTQVLQRARLAEDAYRVFLNAEEVDVLSENMHVVMKEQDRLTALARSSGDDAAKWSQLGDRMRTVASEARLLEGQMTTTAAHSPFGDRLRNLQKQLEKPRAEVDARLAAGAPGKNLLEPTTKLAKATEDAALQMLNFKRETSYKPVETVRNLLNEIGPTWANFEKLRGEVQTASTSDKIAPELRSRMVERRWDLRGELVKLHGDLEEMRGNSDSYFVGDVRAATLVLQGLKAAGTQPDWDKKLAGLDLNFRILESGHNLAETLDGLNQLSVNERWEIYHPRARTSNPRDWGWLEGRLRALPDELGKTQQPEETRRIVEAAQKILWEAQKHPAWKLVSEEMNERLKPERLPMGLPQDVEKLAVLVRQALDLLRKPMDEARQALAKMAPKVSELAADLAKKTEELKKETEEQVQKAAEKKPEEVAAEAGQKAAEQQKLNAQVETLKDLIRAEANKQNIMKEEGRELARDADDALAMLKEPPPKAEQALQEAARADQAEPQQQAMKAAVAEQQKLADALNQIAEHFDNVEKGKAEETRTAMRATEEQNGVKAQLDAQFARAEQFAQMAEKSPQELLKQLEEALPTNPEMQKELSQIAQDSLAGAQEKLAQAAQAEQKVAENLKQMAAQPADGAPAQNAQQAAQKAVAAAEAARKAADEAVQAAKQAGNQTAADQSRKARAEATEAVQAAQQAAEAAAQMAQPNQSPQAAQQIAQKGAEAAQKAAEAAQNAQEAATAAGEAQATAQQAAAQQSGDQQAKSEQTYKEAGEAVQAAQQAAQAARLAEAMAKQAAALASGKTSPNLPTPQQNAATQPANPQLAQAAQQQTPIAQNANQAGQDVARAGRHEERLQNMQAGERLQQLGEQIQQTAANEVPAAQQALTQAQQAQQAQSAVNAANTELASELAQLQAAAGPQDSPAGQQPAMAQQAGQPQPGQSQPGQSQPGQPQPGQPQPGQSQPGQSQPGQSQPGQSQPGQPQPGQPQPGQGQTPPGSQVAAAPPSPQEQVWMARTLDALDAALNAPANSATAEANAQGQPAQSAQTPNQSQPGQPGQRGQPSDAASQAMAQAQAAMAAAAQAAANSMKSARAETPSQTPSGIDPKSDQQAKSLGGTLAQAPSKAYQTPGEANNLKRGDWGKLPKQVAEELTQGQREAMAGEYRSQIETYYRVIAERAKKP